jgi:hypothetical protein
MEFIDMRGTFVCSFLNKVAWDLPLVLFLDRVRSFWWGSIYCWTVLVSIRAFFVPFCWSLKAQAWKQFGCLSCILCILVYACYMFGLENWHDHQSEYYMLMAH